MNPRARYLTTTIAVIAVAAIYVATVERPGPRPAPRPATSQETPRPRLAPPPGALEILATGAVTLSTAQRVRLEALAAAFARDVEPLEARVAAAAEEFSRFMREAQDRERTGLEDVRRRSEDVQALSAELRERRRRHGNEALDVLDERQRAVITQSTATAGGTR